MGGITGSIPTSNLQRYDLDEKAEQHLETLEGSATEPVASSSDDASSAGPSQSTQSPARLDARTLLLGLAALAVVAIALKGGGS